MFAFPYPKAETVYRSIAFFASHGKLSLLARYVRNTLPANLISVFVH